MAATGKPMLLSSGMSSWQDLETAIACVREEGVDVALFQCTTAYPCPPEKWGLNLIQEMKDRFNVPVGFSDHSGNIYAGLAAATMGANMLEIHTVFSYECFGPDTKASVTTADLKRLVDGIRQVERSIMNPIEKDVISRDFTDLRKLFGKSVVAVRDLPASKILEASDLAFKKPGTGIPAAEVSKVIGRRLAYDVTADTLLAFDDLVAEATQSVR
jgi:N-acetylneuraminate synthase